MKTKIYLSLKQEEVATILTALMLYEKDLKDWETEDSYKKIKNLQEIKARLNQKLITTIKLKKRKKDNWPL